jgi:hypothetical protein
MGIAMNIENWPFMEEGEDIWDFIHRTALWRSPMSVAKEAMALGDVTSDTVADRIGRRRTDVESIVAGYSHYLAPSIATAEAVLVLLDERWAQFPMSHDAMQAKVELQAVLSGMLALRETRSEVSSTATNRSASYWMTKPNNSP